MMKRIPFFAAVFAAALCWYVSGEPTRAAHPMAQRHVPFSRGVLAQSHAYHRSDYGQAFAPQPRPHTHGPSRYAWGFPTSTYRWGWFGAERYYPRTTSHRGHKGNHWQWAYRRGY